MTDALFTIVLDRLQVAIAELERSKQARRDLENRLAAAEDKLASIGSAPKPNDVVELIACMAAGKKIEAIKWHRTLTGYGLKESKDAIESVMGVYRPSAAA